MPLDDLARVEDLEERLGRQLEADEHPRAAALLRDASAAVRLETGQQFTRSTSTVRLRARQRIITLAQRPVVEIISVTRFSDDAAVDFTWDGLQSVCLEGGLLDLGSFERDAAPALVLDISYDHGYDDMPDMVVAITADAALRAFGSPIEDAGVSSESLGSYSESRSVTLATVTAQGAVALLDSERLMLQRFAFRPSPIRTAWV